jgi:hypothetical protein
MLGTERREKLVNKYMQTPTALWPRELFWYVQGYCGAIGGCGDVICSAIDQWFRRKKKNRWGTE